MSDLPPSPIEIDLFHRDLIHFDKSPSYPSPDHVLHDDVSTPESAAAGSLLEPTRSLPSSITTNLTMDFDLAVDPRLSVSSSTRPLLGKIPDLITAEEDHFAGVQTLCAEQHDLFLNAPIILSRIDDPRSNERTSLTQFGLVGAEKQESDPSHPKKSISEPASVLANMDVPWSAFICGSQGAGKSHTLSCLLENGLLQDRGIGHLSHPLSAIVFHYDTYSGTTQGQVCEAAYLCSSGIPVTVLVSPSNVWNMTKQYSQLPGLSAASPAPKVLPLYLSDKCLNISTMLKLMSVDPNSSSVPLYMETVMGILRTMAMEGNGADAFSYTEFKTRLSSVRWVRGQSSPLNMRLQLVESFLEPNAYTRSTRPAAAQEDIWAFQPGTMTIVDLSDPFVSSNDACALFGICLSQFLESKTQCGRVVALDEAHKFLTQSGEAKVLTNDLTAIIRQQRHTGTRVFISTQEPTLSPDIIDLANVTFVHRFSSPAWYDMLKHHLAAAHKRESCGNKQSLFETIVALQTGEALLFCPTAASDLIEMPESSGITLRLLGGGYLKIKVRPRVTFDGGRSILASTISTHNRDEIANLNIPMHVVPEFPKSTFTPRHNRPNRAPKPTAQPLPVASPQAQSSTLGQVTQPQPSTDTRWFTKKRADAVMKRQLHQETRDQVRARFQRSGNGTETRITLREVSRDVENALGIPAGTLLLDKNTYGSVLESVARDECAKLRSG